MLTEAQPVSDVWTVPQSCSSWRKGDLPPLETDRCNSIPSKDCDHESEEGVKICNGGVIREKETTVQICVDGKLKYKKKEEVDPGYPLW